MLCPTTMFWIIAEGSPEAVSLSHHSFISVTDTVCGSCVLPQRGDTAPAAPCRVRFSVAITLPPGSYTVFPLSVGTSMSLVHRAGKTLDFLHRFN